MLNLGWLNIFLWRLRSNLHECQKVLQRRLWFGWKWLEAVHIAIGLRQIIIQAIGTLQFETMYLFQMALWDDRWWSAPSNATTQCRQWISIHGNQWIWHVFPAPGAGAIHPWILVRSSVELPCRRSEKDISFDCHKVHLGKTICQSGTCHFECTKLGFFCGLFHLGGFDLQVVYSDRM